jgi:uncharacterized protein YecE (DUF72 family)
MSGRLRYGTSSWSEKSWAGVFYPDGLPPGDWLAHYATVFDTVEADVTYYRVPDRRLVDGWNAKTPDGFVLSAKFPRSIVHGGSGEKPDGARVLLPELVGDDTARFLDAMGRLGPKCGPLVLQFPYFNRQAFASKAPFLERLDAFLGGLPADFRYGVEIRNKAWLGEDLLRILRAHRTALVLVDMVYMPHPADLLGEIDPVTTDFVYARLIGDRKAVEAETATFDRVVVDQSARLDRWAQALRQLLEHVPEAYVYANNHSAGHAPATIRDLVARVGAR